MGFMSRYAGTEKVDVTDLGPGDGTEYWVEIRSLSGDEWDRADAVQVKVAANLTVNAAKAARQAAAKRRAALANGRGVEDDDDLTTMLSFDTPGYKRAVLDAGIVSWNLTDQFGRPLPLAAGDPQARGASIAVLPGEVRDRLFERIEATRPRKRTSGEDADFRGDVPLGGEAGPLGASADPGDLDAGDLVVAHWADAGERPAQV